MTILIVKEKFLLEKQHYNELPFNLLKIKNGTFLLLIQGS